MLKTLVMSIAFLFCLSGMVASFLIIQRNAEKYSENVNNIIIERNERIEKVFEVGK